MVKEVLNSTSGGSFGPCTETSPKVQFVCRSQGNHAKCHEQALLRSCARSRRWIQVNCLSQSSGPPHPQSAHGLGVTKVGPELSLLVMLMGKPWEFLR